jgi:hypothetical protein
MRKDSQVPTNASFSGASGRKSRILNKLISRPMALGAAVLSTAIILGCMNFSFSVGGSEHKNGDEEVLCQEGETTLQPGQSLEVFYPIAYEHPPNLELSSTFNEYDIIDQRMDCFRVRNRDQLHTTSITWKARGTKCLPKPVPVEGPAITPAPAAEPSLPATPIPYQSPPAKSGS